jgi:flagellar hook-associated protein 2
MISAKAVRGDDAYEMLIKSIITIESQPKQRLLEEKKTQERLKGVMSDFSTKLTELQSALRKLSDPVSPLLAARAATTSATAFSVSATDRAHVGTHMMEVHRLASSDTRISQQYTKEGNALGGFNGQHSFSVEVSSPTAADPNRRVAIAVDVELDGANDGERLAQVRDAVDRAMRDAAEAGTIKRSEIPAVSLVSETSSTSRLAIRSAQSGFEGRLDFVDGGSGLLSALGINNDALAEGTSGGMSRLVGTSDVDSELNAMFTLDGLTMYRSSNRVTDALGGITLELNHVSNAGGESFSVNTDSESIRGTVEDFIEKYNSLLKYISSRSQVDADAGTRGDFAGDATIRSLRMDMRSDLARAVTGGGADIPSLADLGITTARDGTITLSDTGKLDALLADDPEGIQALFGSTDGLAARLENRLDRFIGSKGLISERQSSFDARIKRLDSRIKTFETNMSRREDALRLQFAKMQESIAVLQGQQNFFLSFFMGGY